MNDKKNPIERWHRAASWTLMLRAFALIILLSFTACTHSPKSTSAEPLAYPALVLTVADELAIRRLIARYSHAFDAGDATLWSELFAPNAQLITPLGNSVGRPAILAWGKQRIKTKNPNQQTRHFVVNSLMRPLDKRRVRVRSTLLLTAQPKQVIGDTPAAQLLATGIYEDIVQRVQPAAGKPPHDANHREQSRPRWEFLRREIHIDLPLDPGYF